jgi:hypothetical protein
MHDTLVCMARKKSVDDLGEAELKGKCVFVCADLNVSLDDKLVITNDMRIRAAVPTIKYLIKNGAKVIVSSHFICSGPIGFYLLLSILLVFLPNKFPLLITLKLCLSSCFLSFLCYQFSLTFTPTPSSCPGSTERRDGQILPDSFGSKAFRASWCGGIQSLILRSYYYCCFFFFFLACICIGLLCFKKFALIQKIILLQLQKDMCEFGLMFVSLSIGCEGR